MRTTRGMTVLIALLLALLLPDVALSAKLDDVMADAKDGKLEKFSLIEAMLLIDKTTAGEATQLSTKATSTIGEFVVSGGSGAKDAESILKSLKSKLLKQYWPGSSFSTTLNENKFDPLWGTALFVEILKKSSISCSVIESPAIFFVAVKDASGEVIFDVVSGMDPIKTNFGDYITKSAGLRTSLQVKKLAPFSLSSAKRHDCSRMLTGAIQKRLIQDFADDDFKNYTSLSQSLNTIFPDVIIDQDKIVDELSKKLKNSEDAPKTIALLTIAKEYATKPGIDQKEMSDNIALAARKTYLALKAANKIDAMDSYLASVKPLIPKDVYLPMAKEVYLTIHNEYWKKKDYNNVEKYASILWKDLGLVKAKEFWVKSLLIPAQDLAKAKKYDQALAKVDKVLKTDGKDQNAQKIREYIYQLQYNEYKEKNDYSNMLTILDKLRILYPADESYKTATLRTYWSWGQSYLTQNNYPEALKVLTEGHKKFKDYEPLRELLSTAYKNYSTTLAKANDRLKAIETLKKANDVFGDYDAATRNDFIAELYLRLSIQEANKNNKKDAMSYCEKCLIYAPDNEQCKIQQDNLKRGKESVEEKEMDYAPWE